MSIMCVNQDTHTRMHTHHSIIFITKACGIVLVRILSEKQKLQAIYIKIYCRAGEASLKSIGQGSRKGKREGQAGTLRYGNGSCYP